MMSVELLDWVMFGIDTRAFQVGLARYREGRTCELHTYL